MRYRAALCLGLVLLLPRSVFASTTTSVLLPESPLTQTATSTASEAFQPEQYGLAAAYAMTPKTRRELYAWNADKVWPLASLTKLVAASAWQGKTVPWRAIMTIQKRDEVGGGRLRVPVGTRIRFEDLWYASITASANNAAMMVARAMGVTPKQYVALMQKEAKKVGAKSAVFAEPSGMSEENQATAKDMALMADRAFSYRPLQKAASTATYTVNVLNGTPKNRPIKSTNPLLTDDPDVWVIAGKTGYLEASRYNFVGWLRPVGIDGKPETGKDVLVVVFGAPTKEQSFAAAKHLAQSLWSSHATFSRTNASRKP